MIIQQPFYGQMCTGMVAAGLQDKGALLLG